MVICFSTPLLQGLENLRAPSDPLTNASERSLSKRQE